MTGEGFETRSVRMERKCLMTVQAPRDDVEDNLLRYLRKEFGRVSIERILAGPGFFNVYRFLRDSGWAKESPEIAARL